MHYELFAGSLSTGNTWTCASERVNLHRIQISARLFFLHIPKQNPPKENLWVNCLYGCLSHLPSLLLSRSFWRCFLESTASPARVKQGMGRSGWGGTGRQHLWNSLELQAQGEFRQGSLVSLCIQIGIQSSAARGIWTLTQTVGWEN